MRAFWSTPDPSVVYWLEDDFSRAQWHDSIPICAGASGKLTAIRMQVVDQLPAMCSSSASGIDYHIFLKYAGDTSWSETYLVLSRTSGGPWRASTIQQGTGP